MDRDKEQETEVPVAGTDHPHDHQHHHHHGHHHHRSRQKKKRRSRNKILTFVMEHKKQLAGVAVALGLLIFLVVLIFQETAANRKAMGALADGTGQTTTPPRQEVELTPLTVRLPWLPEEVELTGAPVRTLLEHDGSVTAGKLLESYRKENDRLDVGLPVELSFDVVSLPLGERVVDSRVDVWPEGEPDGKQSFGLGANRRSLSLTGLRTGATYRYEITVILSGDTEHTVGGTFRTAASPRILSVGGIRNVRDLGGWTTVSGKTLRQGLLYRGSELDGAVVDYLKITDTGRQEMLSRFGIRAELDLRDTGTGTNALGANVRHIYFGMPAFGGIFSEEGKAPVRQLFGTLADPDAYPVYLHDTYGVDRTGTACYLLQALLGVSEEDLIREYELSALAYETVDRTDLEDLTGVLMTYGGADLMENVELYLQSAGVTQDQIEAIRQIWLY
jgi:hypothetical protein